MPVSVHCSTAMPKYEVLQHNLAGCTLPYLLRAKAARLCCTKLADQSSVLFSGVQVQRHESCSIFLHGRSEFSASNVTLTGDQSFEVPDGYKMTVSAGPDGAIRQALELLQAEPSWQWKYTMAADRNIKLHMETASSARHRDGLAFDAHPLSYII